MKKENKKPEPIYYDVVVETDVAAVLKFRVLAESPEEAVKKITPTTAPKEFKPIIQRRRDKKATVYEAGSLIIKHSERYRS